MTLPLLLLTLQFATAAPTGDTFVRTVIAQHSPDDACGAEGKLVAVANDERAPVSAGVRDGGVLLPRDAQWTIRVASPGCWSTSAPWPR